MRAGLCASRLEPVLTRLCTWQKKLKAAAEEEQAKKRRLLKELNEDIKKYYYPSSDNIDCNDSYYNSCRKDSEKYSLFEKYLK